MTNPIVNYPAQKNVQPMVRYRCVDGHVFLVVRSRALRGYNPVLACSEVPIHPLFVGDVCRKAAVHVGEGGFLPVRVKDRKQRREALRARGLKSLPVYRRSRGELRPVLFTQVWS